MGTGIPLLSKSCPKSSQHIRRGVLLLDKATVVRAWAWHVYYGPRLDHVTSQEGARVASSSNIRLLERPLPVGKVPQ